MKLKLIVATMGLLGLISCPVFAAETDMTTDTTAATDTASATAATENATTATKTTTTAKHGHKHHHHHAKKVKHHAQPMPAPAPAAQTSVDEPRVSFKDEMPASVCSISPSTLIMNSSMQNIGRAMPNPCNAGWFNRIQVSGGANFDFGKWGNNNANFQGENYKRFSLNDAYVNVAANVNEWANAFMSISYSDTTYNAGSDTAYYGMHSSWDYNYSNVYGTNRLDMEQGYFTIGNLSMSPFYVQMGKFFQDYGRYEIHPITRTMTQVMTETLAEAIKVGMIWQNGFSGSAFVFDNSMSQYNEHHSNNEMNYGLNLAYDHQTNGFNWRIGGSYLNNIIGVDDIAHGVAVFNTEGYHHSVAGAAVYGDLNSGPFGVHARWTGAFDSFNVMDLPENGWASYDPNNYNTLEPNASGAKPWAFSLYGTYMFDPWNRIYTATLGYEASSEAAGLGLPENRWVAGLGVEVLKNTNLALEWDHDMAYSNGHGGTGNTNNLFTLRAGVQFG